MQKMLVQVKLNFFMTDTAMEKRNCTARNLLSFRSAYYLPTDVLSNQLIDKRIYQLVLMCNSFYEPWPNFRTLFKAQRCHTREK